MTKITDNDELWDNDMVPEPTPESLNFFMELDRQAIKNSGKGGSNCPDMNGPYPCPYDCGSEACGWNAWEKL